MPSSALLSFAAPPAEGKRVSPSPAPAEERGEPGRKNTVQDGAGRMRLHRAARAHRRLLLFAVPHLSELPGAGGGGNPLHGRDSETKLKTKRQ